MSINGKVIAPDTPKSPVIYIITKTVNDWIIVLVVMCDMWESGVGDGEVGWEGEDEEERSDRLYSTSMSTGYYK